MAWPVIKPLGPGRVGTGCRVDPECDLLEPRRYLGELPRATYEVRAYVMMLVCTFLSGCRLEFGAYTCPILVLPLIKSKMTVIKTFDRGNGLKMETQDHTK